MGKQHGNGIGAPSIPGAGFPPPQVLKPTPRQVAVAQAYVAGLERDRKRLSSTEEKLQQTVWEVVQLGSYNRALYQLLHQIVQNFDKGFTNLDLINRAESLLEANRPLYESVWSCACGHSKYDHDDNGCMYLGCIPICGTP